MNSKEKSKSGNGVPSHLILGGFLRKIKDYKQETLWYKWRFFLTGIYLISFFMFMLHAFFNESGVGKTEKVIGILVFVLLALLFIYLEWKNRQPFQFRTRR